FLAGNDPFNDLWQILVQKRLAAGQDDDRGAALVDRIERVFDGHALVQDGVGVVDLAAGGANQVALEQRLQHEDERIALAAGKMLKRNISANARNLPEGYAHRRLLQHALSDVNQLEREL